MTTSCHPSLDPMLYRRRTPSIADICGVIAVQPWHSGKKLLFASTITWTRLTLTSQEQLQLIHNQAKSYDIRTHFDPIKISGECQFEYSNNIQPDVQAQDSDPGIKNSLSFVAPISTRCQTIHSAAGAGAERSGATSTFIVRL
ncbi:hypothetical protein EMIT0P265_190013 [Pseudomonas zeae]